MVHPRPASSLKASNKCPKQRLNCIGLIAAIIVTWVFHHSMILGDYSPVAATREQGLLSAMTPSPTSYIRWCLGHNHTSSGRCLNPDRIITVTENLYDFQFRLRQAFDARRLVTPMEVERLTKIFEGKLIDGWPFRQKQRGKFRLYELYAHVQTTSGLISTAEGMWLEFGVHTGSSVNITAHCQRNHKNLGIYGFDTFTGLPEDWKDMPKGFFSLRGKIPPVEPGVKLIKGLFSETLPGFMQEHKKDIVLGMNIDCDLYQGAIETLNMTFTKWTAGTMLHFHEGQEDDKSTIKNTTDQEEMVALHEFLLTHPGIALELLPIRGAFAEPVVFFVVSL